MGSVVTFLSGETDEVALIGFTIQNGIGTWVDQYHSYGGGIYCSGASSLLISNNIISENFIIGDKERTGGGIYCENSTSLKIIKNTITGNSARRGGGISCHNSSSIIINNNTISNNTINLYGGGIDSYNSSNLKIINNIVESNSADYYGGGIICVGFSPLIKNNIITGNSTIAYYGGGIYSQSCSPVITNNTISDNSAVHGGGIAFWTSPNPIVNNCIIWGNFGGEVYVNGGSPVFSYSDIQGGWDGEGNTDVDPLFRNSENGDYHLQSITNPSCSGPPDSPCIDAGDPSICDLILDCDHGLGEIRSDMGAYGGGINCSDIPTLSEWGMIILGLLLLAVGTVAVVRKRKSIATISQWVDK